MKTLKSMRLHIGVFGRTNVGKSSLLNRITNQEISIVSDIAGTTTDVVEKSMELVKEIGKIKDFEFPEDEEGTELYYSIKFYFESTISLFNFPSDTMPIPLNSPLK